MTERFEIDGMTVDVISTARGYFTSNIYAPDGTDHHATGWAVSRGDALRNARRKLRDLGYEARGRAREVGFPNA